MTTCLGNDYIVAIYIDNDKMTTKRLHEKDESVRDNHSAIYRETACIVSKDLKILDVRFLDTITESYWFKDIDDYSVFFIDNIITEYYKALEKEVHARTKKERIIINVFPAYIEYTLNDIIAYWENAQEEYKGGDYKMDFHWVLTLPDEWDAKYFDIIRLQLISINVRSIDNLIIVHNSYSLIRYLQLSHYNHCFVNGEYCIVILCGNNNNVVIYGYEIGPPVRGLNNVASHTLKQIHSIPINYKMMEYLLETIFNGDIKQLDEYNITLESLAALCTKETWEGNFFTMAVGYRHKYLRDVDNSFFYKKRRILWSITFDKLVDNMEVPFGTYIAIKSKIDELSKANNSVRAIVVDDYSSISKAITQPLINLLASIMPTKYHNFNVTEDKIFSSGAAQIVQSQLKIDNYLPQLMNVEALEVISKGNIMYIDINWKQNIVLFIDSSGKETLIENVSDTVEHCCSLENGFNVIKDKNGLHLSNINIKNDFIKMLQLEKLKSTQQSPYSISRFNKKEESLNGNSVSDFIIKKLHGIINVDVKNLSMLQQYQTLIPRDQQKKMLVMYIKCLHLHIIQHLLSKGVIDKDSSFITYFSLDRYILDIFLIDHDEVRTIFSETDTQCQTPHPMKLIHREQLSAVHCKDTIKCFNRVVDYLDYPQYMMQVQLHPTYIDLTLNVILSLNKDITLADNETVLTVKRKRISYNIVDIMGELLWDYIQSREELPIKTCHKHHLSDYEDNILMYIDFSNHFNNWFTNEVYTMINSHGKSEWNKELPMKINTHCDCTFLITPMDISDICIIPAIKQIMSIIYGATINTHIFGETKINHIILMGTIMNIKCKTTHTRALLLLKEYLKIQNKYYKHITLHWSNNEVSKAVLQGVILLKKNPLGGLFEQITAGSYQLQSSSAVKLPNLQKYRLLEGKKREKIIKDFTAATEDSRDGGITFLCYYTEAFLQFDLFYSPNNLNNPRFINSYVLRNIDSYPVTVRRTIGLREVILSFGAGAEGKAIIDYMNTDKFPFRENLTLSPYV
ncbi:hypothetical protein BDB01DRAFT_900858 [Pilobolus umbonatus]|nr:hypothetical protein BDB01DRAFT_900858 [Pilobolus umbonatus]